MKVRVLWTTEGEHRAEVVEMDENGVASSPGSSIVTDTIPRFGSAPAGNVAVAAPFVTLLIAANTPDDGEKYCPTYAGLEGDCSGCSECEAGHEEYDDGDAP